MSVGNVWVSFLGNLEVVADVLTEAGREAVADCAADLWIASGSTLCGQVGSAPAEESSARGWFGARPVMNVSQGELFCIFAEHVR